MAPTYSSVLKAMVQSYRIHLILGTVLDKDRNETAMQLASPDENGIYQGFMGVNGWTNWWFREANNVLWGNLGKEGMTFHKLPLLMTIGISGSPIHPDVILRLLTLLKAGGVRFISTI